MNWFLQKKIKIKELKEIVIQALTIVFFCLIFSITCEGQIINGTIVDKKTKELLQFVHIGVLNENKGVISDDEGKFEIDLKNVSNKEKIVFSIIGYESISIPISDLKNNFLQIELEPKEYLLNEIVVKPLDIIDIIKIGRYKLTTTTTGQSGIEKFGYGGEWGIQIKNEGKKYQIEDVNFHTRFNTVDSVLFRINIYRIAEDLPVESILNNEIYTKSYAKDKWISKNLISENLIIEEDIIVTFELVRIWYNEKGQNQLFYTHGKGYEEGKSYSRDSSFDKWKINKRGPIAMYITGRILK